jgi:hypothetical protein
VSNTVTYYDAGLITTVKSFVVEAKTNSTIIKSNKFDLMSKFDFRFSTKMSRTFHRIPRIFLYQIFVAATYPGSLNCATFSGETIYGRNLQL